MQNAWMVRPKPNGIDRMSNFLEDNCIAIGYPVGKSLEGFSKQDIIEILEQHDMGGGKKNADMFVNYMKPEDVVVVPYDDKIYFAKVTSDYQYVRKLDNAEQGWPHQREVEWLIDKHPISRDDLPKPLRDSLQYPGGVASLTKHMNIILDIIKKPGEQVHYTTVNEDGLISNKQKVINFLFETVNDRDIEMEYRLQAAEILLKQ